MRAPLCARRGQTVGQLARNTQRRVSRLFKSHTEQAYLWLEILFLLLISASYVVPGAGLEPARPQWPGDFKSPVSTNFTTRAYGGLSGARSITR